MLDHLIFDLDFETYKRVSLEDPELYLWIHEENKVSVLVSSSVLNLFETLSALKNMILRLKNTNTEERVGIFIRRLNETTQDTTSDRFQRFSWVGCFKHCRHIHVVFSDIKVPWTVFTSQKLVHQAASIWDECSITGRPDGEEEESSSSTCSTVTKVC